MSELPELPDPDSTARRDRERPAAEEAEREPATTSRPTRAPGSSTSRRLGAGLVEMPETPVRDPSEAILANPSVAESRRFCASCRRPVGRGRHGFPGPGSGICENCGTPFTFEPHLAAGDLVAGQYEVAGCIAHGGMGWVYLARDLNVSGRWVVLKGLLDTGDPDAMDAALAERRFLAEVEHPNIVKIFNFVQHATSGYIVMEYLGGRSLRQILEDHRTASGDSGAPLPPAQAIAYMLEILPAIGYLHELGLVFCDFKLENVIQTRHVLKLIDLGGVQRLDEESEAVFGTVGYQAPEIAEDGPSVASDLFTVARALALLCIDFQDHRSAFRYTLPPVSSVPLFERYDSLYRLLCKATARDPDDRFQSAGEMAEQLVGVLREVVAFEEGRAVPAPSNLFSALATRAEPDELAPADLPQPQIDGEDPIDVRLRLAAATAETGEWDAFAKTIGQIEAESPWEWRATWLRGVRELVEERPADARDRFLTVYRAVPGELAPKLALGLVHELLHEYPAGVRWYERVARTDPASTAAWFGLARCRLALGTPDDLVAVGEMLDTLELDAEPRLRLTAALLEARLDHGAGPEDRRALESTYRALARNAPERAERFEYVDRANQVRPWTWT